MPTDESSRRPTSSSVWPRARAIHRLLPRRLRRRWAALSVLTGACAVAELATTALLLSVIRLATQPAGAAPPASVRLLPGTPVELAGVTPALLATILVTAVILLRAALAFALAGAATSTTAESGVFISETLLAHYLRMPYARFRDRRVAELHRRVTNVARTVVTWVFRPGVQLVSDLAIGAAVLAIMVLASPGGTLAAVVLVGGVSLILIRAVNPRLYRSSALMEQHDRSATLFVDQVLHGRREITLRHHEAPVIASYREERGMMVGANRQQAIAFELPRILIEGMTMVIVSALIIFAVGLELDTPRVVATLGLFAYALVRLMPMASRVANNVASVRAGLPMLDAVLEDMAAARTDAALPTNGGLEPPPRSPLVGAIEFRQVSSWYEASRPPVLREVSVRIEPGSFVGIVGPSGAGKSTFVDLLLGLLVPTSGEVRVDGRPLAELAAGWQAGVGVVSQEPYIFNDSILRNIVLFANTVDHRRVVEVLEDVGLWPLVQELSHGLDTQIGDRGSALSGGQRQRLAVARALYSNPRLLVLDEATSALDADGEATVMRAALRGAMGRTVVVVTHRPSAIADCDQIIVLENGVVTASGSFADVLAKSAYFARMVSTSVPPTSPHGASAHSDPRR
jgi:ABC-type multidrug transport system fused ATPase/permease subunit